ncbi:MAG: MBOAT family protein [Bacteroidaceae bacterium]|nr:MBOAT family protein [Bacteroidaceae bacterium]
MLFNSFEFVVFLPLVFLLYWFVFRSRRWQNFFVLVASYVFYGWWNWRFLLLIAFTSACSYISGVLIERSKDLSSRRWVSAANIVVNLLVLAVFKYYNFFTENVASLCNLVGYELDWATLNIVLPVGISFYTFQALSYSIDVYRGNIRATHDPVEFFAYISFFPQLVAGPIERATNLLPQFQKSRSFNYAKAVDGCRQMLWGFFKKLVVADNCAVIVNQYWDSFSGQTGFHLLLVVVLFAFQIYCDFSGYSDIAIGCSRLFGIDLKRNFNYPYFSRDIAELWRKWHISLMTWFRDYVYYPLGGSRCSKTRAMWNTVVVFFLSGLWHGANWTFVIWGLYNALLLIIGSFFGLFVKSKDIPAEGKIFPSIKEFCKMLFTFFLFLIGLIIFRSQNMGQAIGYLCQMFSPSLLNVGGLDCIDVLLWGILMLVVEWLQRDKQHALQMDGVRFFRMPLVRYAIYLTLFVLIIHFTGEVQTFIYFQF